MDRCEREEGVVLEGRINSLVRERGRCGVGGGELMDWCERKV